jgi:YD repeat-containing protein
VTQQAGGVLRIAGTVNEPATVRVDGRPAPVDPSGQFVGGVPVAAGTTRFTVAATDASGNTRLQTYEVDQVGAAKTFTFDANGNLTSAGTRTFEWDARNQLVAINEGTHLSEFTYDGEYRRVRIVEKENGVTQSDTKVAWCEKEICEERAADGTTVTRRAFTHGEQVVGASRFFARNHLDSVAEVTDGTSTVLAGYAFDPWERRNGDRWQ